MIDEGRIDNADKATKINTKQSTKNLNNLRRRNIFREG